MLKCMVQQTETTRKQAFCQLLPAVEDAASKLVSVVHVYSIYL